MENNSHGFDRNLYALIFTSMHGEPTNNHTFTEDYRAQAHSQALDRAIDLGYRGDDIIKVMGSIIRHINANTQES